MICQHIIDITLLSLSLSHYDSSACVVSDVSDGELLANSFKSSITYSSSSLYFDELLAHHS